MARDRATEQDFGRPLRRLLGGLVVLGLFGLFVLWRADGPRVERIRAAVIDEVVPRFDWARAPVMAVADLVSDFRSYQRIAEQNRELRRQLQKMKAWKEAALQLEQENARLLDLNKVRLDPRLTYITGVVIADSGSPFRQTVLINVGVRDGIRDGWAAMDGLGLVGRIAGVGRTTSRVILVTDPASRIPALIQPSGQKALVTGDNGPAPLVAFVEAPDRVRPGDQVVTSGDGGVYPPGLPIGHLARDAGGRLRVIPSAELDRLEFLRVLRDHGRGDRPGTPRLILPAGDDAYGDGAYGDGAGGDGAGGAGTSGAGGDG